MPPAALSARLAELSALEIADALGIRKPLPRALVIAAARLPSAKLGRVLARFDERIATHGLACAARTTLDELGARLEIEGAAPARGGALVVFLAADRPLLRALPNVASHLVLVDERSPIARAAGLRRALDWMARGHVLVQYGAGAIEPDARFHDDDDDDDVLGAWHEGTGVLAARAPRVVPAFVSGVHSPRAKRLPIVRWAERRGVTTIAPLVQAALPGFRDVFVSARFGLPIGDPRTAIIRAAVAQLRETQRRTASTSEASRHTRAHSPRARDGAPSSG